MKSNVIFELIITACVLPFLFGCVTKESSKESVPDDFFPQNFGDSKLEYRTSGFICDDPKVPQLINEGKFNKPLKFSYGFGEGDNFYFVLTPNDKDVIVYAKDTINIIQYKVDVEEQGFNINFSNYSESLEKDISENYNMCDIFFTDVQIRESGYYFEINKVNDRTNFCTDSELPVFNEMYLDNDQFAKGLGFEFLHFRDGSTLRLFSEPELKKDYYGDEYFSIGTFDDGESTHDLFEYSIKSLRIIEFSYDNKIASIDICQYDDEMVMKMYSEYPSLRISMIGITTL